MSTQPFRFLDLPAELRCMVYEAIDVATRKEKYNPSIIRRKQDDAVSRRSGKLVMYRRILPMSILATCRLVNREAAPIITRKAHMILKEPVRFYMNWTPEEATQHVLYGCFDTSFTTKRPGTAGFDSRWQFIENCRCYLKAITHARPNDTTVSDVEVTIAHLKLDHDRVKFNTIDFILRNICEASSVCMDMVLKEDPRHNSRIDAAMPAQPGLTKMDNWRTMARRVSDVPGVRLRDMDDDEWADHMQMLKEL
ncbi:hypothetical protein J4E80_005095 [Alternaria sp. BMP 0032]|nr:hypothetical protein J4E80_005095 [Alternaria sp. BMP 0032]